MTHGNIVVRISENRIDCNTFYVKSRQKYSRSRQDGKTGQMASLTRARRQGHEMGVLVRMPRWANLFPVAVLVLPALVSKVSNDSQVPEG